MEYKIPLFELNFDEAEENAALETIRSKWISTGPKTTEFENKFSSMLNVKHSVALSNCTVALHLAMKILGIKNGDEVICPSLTFVATANSIRYVNAIPVFADVKSYDDLTLDPEDIERKITAKTKAITVMHYGGFACDMDSIMVIAKKYDLKVMTSLSYERSKGHSTSYDVVDLGFNYRMDDIRSSIGIVQLDKIETDLKNRAEVRKFYIKELSEISEIIIPFKDYSEFSSNYIFPVILKNSTYEKRDLIRNKLAEAGIQTSVHYPAVHKFSIYKDFYREMPVTDYITDNLITLPMYANLKKDDVGYICENLKNSLKC